MLWKKLLPWVTSVVTFQAQLGRGQWPIGADWGEITGNFCCSYIRPTPFPHMPIWEQKDPWGNLDTETAGQEKMWKLNYQIWKGNRQLEDDIGLWRVRWGRQKKTTGNKQDDNKMRNTDSEKRSWQQLLSTSSIICHQQNSTYTTSLH